MILLNKEGNVYDINYIMDVVVVVHGRPFPGL